MTRKHFLTLAAALPAGLMAAADAPKKYPIGLELYSVRNELARDLPHTLKAVAGFGYEIVEFYSPYYGWSLSYAKDVRKMMDDLGIRCLSTHNSISSYTPGEGEGKAVDLNQIIGSTTLILPGAPGSVRGLEGWKKFSEQMSAASARLKKHGLAAGFHNHASEWVALDGTLRIMDVLAANTPDEFVLQLDVGTCVEAGADPVAWINAHPGRIRSLHLKDWAPGSAADEKSFRVLYAEGVCPWKEILAAAEAAGGVDYYLIEQEGSRYPELDTARRCLETWRKMRKAA